MFSIDVSRGKGPGRIAANQAGGIENARATFVHTHLPQNGTPTWPTRKSIDENKNQKPVRSHSVVGVGFGGMEWDGVAGFVGLVGGWVGGRGECALIIYHAPVEPRSTLRAVSTVPQNEQLKPQVLFEAARHALADVADVFAQTVALLL